MIKDSTILILGAGQIGRAACIEILKRHPKEIILHTLEEEEAKVSKNWIKQNCPENIKCEIDCKLKISHGDVINAYPDSKTHELEFRFGIFTDSIYKASLLWKIIKKYKPNMIVDGINTATAVGYGQDPYTASRGLKSILEAEVLPNSDEIRKKIEDNLLSEAIPCLIRFTQVLHKAMITFDVAQYVKISTSGLGGMGFNIAYTHGDTGEPGLSTKLLGKVAAAGIFNQLLWTLSRTPGLDIKVIIPTALVGWDSITKEVKLKLKTRGKKSKSETRIPLYDCESPLTLLDEDIFNKHKPKSLKGFLEMVAIDSGENGHYALGDMTTITTLGQMGCVTKEEIGMAVAESLEGSTKYDVCTALDSACLGPSLNAAFERKFLLTQMQEKDEKMKTSSVSIGNLGPEVTKHLWELEVLKVLCSSLIKVVKCKAIDIAENAEILILKNDKGLRQQILSLQMPILLEGNRILLGATWHIPEDREPKNILENMDRWADDGWVDLRTKRISYWQAQIKKVIKLYKEFSISEVVQLNRNWHSFSLNSDFNVGEVLGFIYSIDGGDRKID